MATCTSQRQDLASSKGVKGSRLFMNNRLYKLCSSVSRVMPLWVEWKGPWIGFSHLKIPRHSLLLPMLLPAAKRPTRPTRNRGRTGVPTKPTFPKAIPLTLTILAIPLTLAILAATPAMTPHPPQSLPLPEAAAPVMTPHPPQSLPLPEAVEAPGVEAPGVETVAAAAAAVTATPKMLTQLQAMLKRAVVPRPLQTPLGTAAATT
mmetsp:Transcript_33804/g.66508  ORF Transcript_33804/g.66508 Transcript_33804/m.66508 type:complete len:205 (-) Transcript_33804:296-910(-)